MPDYTMDPDNDTILYADELTENMKVLKEGMYAGGSTFRYVTKLRTYITHESGGMFSSYSPAVKHITFVGIDDSGHQEVINTSPHAAFVVKKDSIPGREQVMENSGIPGGIWEETYPYGRGSERSR